MRHFVKRYRVEATLAVKQKCLGEKDAASGRRPFIRDVCQNLGQKLRFDGAAVCFYDRCRGGVAFAAFSLR